MTDDQDQKAKTMARRPRKVMEAIMMGYSQQEIANVIGIAQPAVSLIVKKNR